MESLFDNIRSYIRTVPKNRLYLYVMLLLAGIGVAVIGLSFIEREEYQPLFAGLTTEDASTVVARLKEQKIPYKLGANGTTVLVPKERASEVRLLLASANAMPGGGGVGLELFDKTSYGMTEFMQTVNYKRAIQGELTRTINQMPEVKACRIHIAIPEKTLFTEKEQEVTASVFLKLKPGRELSREQVAGVVQLVAGSIEGLKPGNVVVVDSSGRVLHKSGDGGSGLVVSGQQYELQKSVEKKIEESVQSMLQTVLMNSRSIVRASVDLNLRKVEKVEEEYAPDKKVVTQEKKSRERSINSKPKAGGVAGAAANLAAAASKTQKHEAGNPKHEEQSSVSEMEREDVQTGYEVSKSVRKIVEPFGDIKRMSLAVLVDGKYEKTPGKSGEALRYIPRSQQELNNIRNVAARAAGLNEERGDKIEVINMPFEVEIVPEEKTFLKPENKELALNLGKYAFYLVIVLCVFFFLLKPISGMLKKKGDVHPLQAVKDVYVKGGAPAAAIPAVEKPQPALMEALNDKALVGSIIREWVKENP